MSLTKQQLKQIIKEEFVNLVNEEEIDEKLLSALKGIGKGLYNKATDFMSGKPKPNASQGVGRAFARYKVPQKQPIQPEPEIEPGVGLVRRNASQGMQTSDSDAEQPAVHKDAPFGSSYSVNQPKQLGTGQPTDSASQDVESSGDLPPGNLPKQLPAPERIGVVQDYGDLLRSTIDESFSLLRQEVERDFINDQRFKSLNTSQKKETLNNINTVLKHLVGTKRVLQNSTIGPITKDIKEEREKMPSYQQVGLEPWYINSLIITTKKYFSGRIPQNIVEYVITTLFKQGRLAISTRLYNKLLHTNDPAIRNPQDLDNLESQLQQESKSYDNFYNNWKRYTKPGVKI
jgi:hypothetical protein